jgi:hypothetical protein
MTAARDVPVLQPIGMNLRNGPNATLKPDAKAHGNSRDAGN